MCKGEPLFDNINRKTIDGDICVPRLKDGVSVNDFIAAPDDKMEQYLVVKVNGKRIFCKGGNWGMDDATKHSSREHLEPYFRLHKEANFNMVRNWTGESTEEVFYQLCDEYGMLVFNDFWLSTQGYNLDVLDDDLFLKNAEDVVVRFRNHPSIAIWNPRNEGYATAYIEEGLAKMIAEKDGTRYYSPNSRYCNLTPSGPWQYFENPVDYYTKNAHGFNTELGTPSVPTEESILKMMDVKDAWPISDVWYYHDLHNGQKEYMQAISDKFGDPSDLKDFSRKAQIINYESYRSMFEAWNSKMWNSTSGLLLWMTHPAWPSFDWQVYSWDYETFGSYYGARKACEPIHIQKNLDDERIVIVNTTLKDFKDAKVKYEVYSLDGKRIIKKELKANIAANSLTPYLDTKAIFASLSQSGILLERLTLMDSKGKIISCNDYWNKNQEDNFFKFNSLDNAKISGKIKKNKNGKLTLELKNTGSTPAISLKLNLRDAQTGERILPVYCSDGYFNLIPGEKREVQMDSDNNKGYITIEGYNLERIKLVNIL